MIKRYEIKKTRYPNSYYDVLEFSVFGFVLLKLESWNKHKY